MAAAAKEMKLEGNSKGKQAKKKEKGSKALHQMLGGEAFKRGLKRTYDEYSVEGSGVSRDRFISATSYFWRKRGTESLRSRVPETLLFLLQHWALRRHQDETFSWGSFYKVSLEMFQAAALIN